MAAIKLLEEAEAQGKAAELYETIKKAFQLDSVPNTFKAMGNVPSFLADVLKSEERIFGKGNLARRTKEFVAIAVSAANGCDYCVSAHSAIAQGLGATNEEIADVLGIAGLFTAFNTYFKFREFAGSDFEKDVPPMSTTHFKESKLSKEEIELVGIAVSTVNGCSWCVDHHVKKSLKMGISADDIREAMNVAALMGTFNTFNKALGLEIDIAP